MTRSRRAAALAPVAALSLLLAACGGDDDPAAGGGDTGEAVPAPSTVVAEVPDATVLAELPEEYVGEVQPIEVRGEALPDLAGAAIADDPAVGTAVPVLVGLDYDGRPVTVDPATNGPTMVVFLAHWCPHCNAEVPRLNELRDEGRFPAGLNIVAVSTAIAPDRPNFPPSEWIEDVDWTYPVIADGLAVVDGAVTAIGADAYGVDGFPFVALVDGDGNVAARWSGEREPDEVVAAISEHLGLG